MASSLETKLAAKMHERECRERAMRQTLQNIHDMGLMCSRRLLVHQCLAWMEAFEECNEAARAVADAADAERIARPEMFRGKAIAV